jgi:hypothetical protein
LREHRLAPRGHRVRELVVPAHIGRRRGAHAQPLALLRDVDRRGVRVEHATHLRDELAQDPVERAVRQRRVNKRLHAGHELGHALGLGPRGLLSQQRLALGLAAGALGHVGDEARYEHLALDLHLRHRRLTGEAGAVAALELHLVALGREWRLARNQRIAALVVALTELGRED